MGESPAVEVTSWYLETHLDGGRLWRVPVKPLPFRIGRHEGLHLMVPSDAVSSEHAEIRGDSEQLRLCDLGSTNGTFINRERIEGESPIGDSDILHFADFEFRLTREVRRRGFTRRTSILTDTALPESFVAGTKELGELIRDQAVRPVYQPIVELPGGKIAALEALSRGDHPGLPADPGGLFRIAASAGLEVELSQAFRIGTLSTLGDRKDLPPIFLNTHPAEFKGTELIQSLAELRETTPHLQMVVEIHERFLAETRSLQRMRDALKDMDIRLAYDDFGVGQARLLELAEVPPDFLKFDASFIRNIHEAPASKRRLLTSLVAAARDLDVTTVAEGIESSEELEICIQAGFALAQGFYFYRPAPLEEVL